MRETPLVTDAQVELTVQTIPGDAFTIFDFVRTFSALYPEDWTNLVAAYGEKGDGTRRGYTAAAYLGNRLSQLTKKPGSPLLPLVRWQRGGVETPNQRHATAAERAMGAEGIIRVFRKREVE
ncbi:MAG: hypothetical protein ACM3XM_16825 [Mycobacterium leprae]